MSEHIDMRYSLLPHHPSAKKRDAKVPHVIVNFIEFIHLINKHMKYRLIESRETNIPHRGLKAVAMYLPDCPDTTTPGCLSPQRVVFWHKHAPVELDADFITVKLDVPHVWIGKDGNMMRTSTGHLMLTQEEVLFCPKTKEGLYFMGCSPQEQKARLMHRLMPCVWGRPERWVLYLPLFPPQLTILRLLLGFAVHIRPRVLCHLY